MIAAGERRRPARASWRPAERRRVMTPARQMLLAQSVDVAEAAGRPRAAGAGGQPPFVALQSRVSDSPLSRWSRRSAKTVVRGTCSCAAPRLARPRTSCTGSRCSARWEFEGCARSWARPDGADVDSAISTCGRVRGRRRVGRRRARSPASNACPRTRASPASPLLAAASCVLTAGAGVHASRSSRTPAPGWAAIRGPTPVSDPLLPRRVRACARRPAVLGGGDWRDVFDKLELSPGSTQSPGRAAASGTPGAGALCRTSTP